MFCWSWATDCLSEATRCCTSGDWDLTTAGPSRNVALQAATAKLDLKLFIRCLLWVCVGFDRNRCFGLPAAASYTLADNPSPRKNGLRPVFLRSEDASESGWMPFFNAVCVLRCGA